MKKFLPLLAAVGMIFTACQSGGDIEEDNGATPFVPEITISPKDLTFGCNGGEQEVVITANFEYEVAERASWLTVEQTDEGLLVVVDANKNTSERSAFISITNSQYDINKSIEVWQEGFVPKIELAQQSIEVEFEPAEYEVAVNSPYSWEATTKSDWIVVESETGIAGEEVLRFSTKRNEEEKERKGTITLKNSDYNLVAELYVTQKAFAPEWTIEPESLAFTFEGGTQDVAITANFDEYKYSTNADWLTIEKSESVIKVTAKVNANFEERTTEIIISSEKYGISKTIAVTQKGVSAESQNVIIYTSSNGEVVTPYKSDVFGANIVSNTYGNGPGVIIFDAPVTSIGNSAFENCTSLTSIIIPDSVTSIGVSAFDGCSSLTSVTIPDSVISIGGQAFYQCTSLTSVTIGNGVTEIGNWAFYGCGSLTSVIIPDSVTTIGHNAFGACTSLKAFYGKFASSDNRCLIVDGVLKSFAIGCGATEYTIPDSVTSIGNSAFENCSSLTSVTIPDSVTEIGGSAFCRCTSLTSIDIPDSVTEIVSFAFYGCTSLTSVTIPDSVTSIGDYAFRSCTSLTSVTIPDSVTSIGYEAFYGCSSLTSVTVGNSVTSIGSSAFRDCSGELIIKSKIVETDYTYGSDPMDPASGWLYGSKFTKLTIGNSVTSIGNYAFCECTSLTSVTIPDSVTTIGSYAFLSCTSLKSITIPDSVTSIGDSTFSNCSSLTNITIPGSVTSIGDYAFCECTSLTSVTIPDSVTSIGDYAFRSCTSLKEVYCKPTTPPGGGNNMFSYNDGGYKPIGCKIYVPRNSVEAYKAARYWRDYASDIVGYDF